MKVTTNQLEVQTERVLAFLNSRGVGYESGMDELGDPKRASAFLASSFGLDVQASARAVGEMKRLRQVVLELVTTQWKNDAALNQLNEISRHSSFTLKFQDGPQAHLESASSSAVAVIVRDIADLINAGQWDRVKNCSDEACSSTFFDRSRNKTQRWHSFEICGNKHNVAVHRARHS